MKWWDRGEPRYSNAESVARDRAYLDVETKDAFGRFATEHFGGDYQRVAWFLDELIRLRTF